MNITLCGSARFEELWHRLNKELTLCGHVVYSLAVFPSYMNGREWYDEEQKVLLDDVHKKKIENSDAIVIINKDGYLGESTISEIRFARTKDWMEVFWLEPPTPADDSYELLLEKPEPIKLGDE